MAASTYLKTSLGNALVAAAPFSAAGLYVKMHIGLPGPAGLLAEAPETARKTMTASNVAGLISNTGNVEWIPTVGQTWTDFTVWDALSGGNCLLIGHLDVPVTVAGNERGQFPPGTLTTTIL